MKSRANFSKTLLPLIAVAVLLLGLTACNPRDTELSFETIELESNPEHAKQWTDREPKLLIIASTQDIEAARPFVTDEALTALQKMDFTTQFAVLALRGLQGSSFSGFKIEQIIRRGNEIALYAQAGAEGSATVVRSPYHLIKVNKEGHWDSDFTFNLYFDQTGPVAVSTTHHVP
jgi:hypothetical protein